MLNKKWINWRIRFEDKIFNFLLERRKFEPIFKSIEFEIEKLCYETILDKHPNIPQTELKNAASTCIYLSLFEMVKPRIKIETVRDEFNRREKLRGTLFLGVEKSEFEKRNLRSHHDYILNNIVA